VLSQKHVRTPAFVLEGAGIGRGLSRLRPQVPKGRGRRTGLSPGRTRGPPPRCAVALPVDELPGQHTSLHFSNPVDVRQ
jgi:hypothetical protein